MAAISRTVLACLLCLLLSCSSKPAGDGGESSSSRAARPEGMIEQGNIDLTNRPVVRNADGTVSTVRSISVEIDGQEVLIPTVSDDGRILSDQEAVQQYRRTGRHLGKFNSVKAANRHARRIHQEQERLVVAGSNAKSGDPYAGGKVHDVRFPWPDGKRVAVSLSFDDARPSQVDVGVPLLNEYGVRATFYVSPSRVPERLGAWKAAVAAGHEIGNHSMRHACTGNFSWSRQKALEDYTPRQMAKELDQAHAEIQRLLGVRALTFAYPCGQKFVGRGKRVRSYVPLVAERFIAGRGWRDETANDPAFCDPAQLLAVELDGLTFEQLKVLIDAAAEQGSWLVLAGHEIGEKGRQTTRTDTLRAFCEHAADPKTGLWVDTVANVARYVAEHRGDQGGN